MVEAAVLAALAHVAVEVVALVAHLVAEEEVVVASHLEVCLRQ